MIGGRLCEPSLEVTTATRRLRRSFILGEIHAMRVFREIGCFSSLKVFAADSMIHEFRCHLVMESIMLSTRAILPFGCKILIVDDNPEITALLREYLSGIGAVACTVNDGRSALLRLQLLRFDVLIVDLVMPGISGWDILRFTMKSRSDLHSRTIVLTGDQYRLRQSPHASLLPAEVLYKPFQLDDVRRAVCRIIGPYAAMSA